MQKIKKPMQKLHFSIKINAPKKKVWRKMLSDASYRVWTKPFMEGSYFEGSWDKGAKIRFLAKDENGKLSGMTSMIEENIPYEFISIKHLGIVNNGVDDTTSDEVRKWAGAHENYAFKETGGKTEVLVDTDTDEEFIKMFEEMWPKALAKLKEISEKN